jgi:hypothetical protein
MIESNGYGFKMFRTDNPVHKRKYYTKDGREMILPADNYSLEHYLAKGFTLVPPAHPIQTVGENESVSPVATAELPIPVDVESLKCPECGRIAKDNVGLSIHIRKAHHPKRHRKSPQGG